MPKGLSPLVSCQEPVLQQVPIILDIVKNRHNWNPFWFIPRQRHFPFLSSSVDMHRSLLSGGMELQAFYKLQRWLDTKILGRSFHHTWSVVTPLHSTTFPHCITLITSLQVSWQTGEKEAFSIKLDDDFEWMKIKMNHYP